MLALYLDPERVVYPGEAVPLHVSTTAETFQIEIYRIGDCARPVAWSGTLPGALCPPGGPADDWEWPAHQVLAPDQPGLYLLVGVETGRDAGRHVPGLIGFDGTALLCVAAVGGRAALTYKLPVRTYQAYNPAGGGSLYVNQVWRDGYAEVSIRRPGGGVGGPTAEPADVYRPSSPRQTFWHWDAPFLAWAQRVGYGLDVVLDTQLDHAPELLDGVRAVVTAGHDEYWSDTGRRVIEDFVDRGGSLAVLGGNTCWWRADVMDGRMRVAKDRADTSTGPGLWWRQGRPENALLGLSYRNGGGWWGAARPATCYRTLRPNDPLWNGVDRAAFSRLEALAGYEVDGYAHVGDPAYPDGSDGAPDGLTILAYAPLSRQGPTGWDTETREPGNDASALAALAYYRRGRSLVVNAGTVDWPLHLHEPPIDRLTRNILDAVTGTVSPTR